MVGLRSRRGVVVFVVLVSALAALSVPVGAPAGGSPLGASSSPQVCSPVDRAAFEDPELQAWSVSATGGTSRALTAPRDQPRGDQTSGPVFAVSPDGTRLASAYLTEHIEISRTDGSGGVVWITAPRWLASDAELTWSPDGSRLAFVGASGPGLDDRKLWVAPADGSSPPALRSGPDRVSKPTWSPAGDRLAFKGDLQHVKVASASGPVDVDDVSFGMPLNEGPIWSPEGTRLLWASGSGDVVTANADGSGSLHQLTTTPYPGLPNPLWSPDGTKVFWNGLFSREADASQPAVQLAPNTTNARLVGFSPAGDLIAFTAGPNPDPNPRLFVAGLDGSGRVEVSAPASGTVESAVWSKSSSHLAVVQSVGGNVKTSVTTPTGGATLLATGQQLASRPTFDPTGNRVVWSRMLAGISHLVSAPRDGSSAAVQLDPGGMMAELIGPRGFSASGDVLYGGRNDQNGDPNDATAGAWLSKQPFLDPATKLADRGKLVTASPDRSHVAWVSDAQVFVADADGLNIVAIPKGLTTEIRELVWSPTGDRLAWEGSEQPGDRQIFVAPSDGSAVPTVSMAYPISGQPGGPEAWPYDLQWSPAGDLLMFIVRFLVPDEQELPYPLTGSDLWVVAPTNLDDIQLVSPGAELARFSPSGSTIVASSGSGVWKSSRPFIGTETFVGSADGHVVSLAVSPDETKVAVGSEQYPPGGAGPVATELDLMNLDGSSSTKVADGVHARWSPDGSHLAYEEWTGRLSPFPGLPDRYLFGGGTSIGHVVRADGTDDRVIASGPASSPPMLLPFFFPVAFQSVSAPRDLAFAPDGSEVAFNDVVVNVSGPPVHRAAGSVEVWRYRNWLHDDCLHQEPGFHGVSPAARLLDTRVAPGVRLGPGEHVDVQVTGNGGVPASHASAAVVNVTAVNPSAATHVTVGPTGSPLPATSNVNVPAGDTRANLAVARLGTGGKVTLTNNSGSVDLVVDLFGWLDDGTVPTATTGAAFHAMAPARALDTRDGTGAPAGRVGAGGFVQFSLGAVGVPADATAVVLNVTGVDPSAATHLTAGPGEAAFPVPGTSNLNVPAGENRPNLVVVPVGPGGTVRVRNNSGNVDVVADVSGWFGGAAGGGVVATAPQRILDTREAGDQHGPVHGGETRSVPVAGRGGVPTDATAVVVNLTAVGPSSFTHLSLWPSGAAQPVASNLNVPKTRTAANLAIVKLGPDGRINVFNNAGDVDAVLDVMGYIT